MSTGRSIHAVPSITPSLREEIEDGLRLRADRLGLSNRLSQKTAFDLHNKTGRDVSMQPRQWWAEGRNPGNISAVPALVAAQASHPSVSSATFDRHVLRAMVFHLEL